MSLTVSGTATSINAVLAANGAVASASSTYGTGYPASAAINGDRNGLNWGSGGGWNSTGTFPNWLQITFSASRSIAEIDVVTVQDAYTAPVAPTATQTFTKYGIVNFQVQYWNGSAWVTVPGGSVTGNNLVWRKFTFTPISTDRIRVNVTNGLGGYSRITEVEAWTAVGSSASLANSKSYAWVNPDAGTAPGYRAAGLIADSYRYAATAYDSVRATTSSLAASQGVN